MTIGLLSSLRTARLELISNAIDNDADEYDTGNLLIYSGTRPSTGDPIDEYENVELVNFSLPYPCGSIYGNILTFSAVDTVLGLEDGIASWARIVDANGDFVMDLSVTDQAGNGDIKLSSLVIVKDSEIYVVSAALTEGNP
ncbi:MAG: hypothetical protein WC346_00155 [Methanogenium sp.]|jgi:hypothetical protein